ncbi:MAG: translation initiation factor IF-2 [Candidatus Shapirobacteria bacterium]
MLARPPIVGVLGHVDHGKTSLISKIKETDLTKREFGGISQHTAAYQISYEGQKITFIDTPGHAAFAKMRSRGARVADLIILVVAADEGVKPQTKESLKHIEAAGLPFLVAINKMDLPEADVNKAKQSLAEAGVLVEGYGGSIVAVQVSAKTGKGIKELLEMTLLMAEMQEIRADKSAQLEAVVVESRRDSRRGIVASLLIRDGSLQAGEEIEIEGEKTKVKMMFDDLGQPVTVALPGQPVEVLGFKKMPPVGVKIGSARPGQPVEELKKEEIEAEKEEAQEKIKIILKADVTGTLEAILESLPTEVEVIAKTVGTVNDSEVLLAKSVGAEIIAFNARATAGVLKLAETEGVKIKSFQIIYELLAYLEKRVLKLLQPTFDEEILGQAEILARFEMKGQHVLGARVIEGEIKKTEKLRVKRGEALIGEGRLKSLKKDKMDVLEVKKGEEFGAVLAPEVDFEVGDLVISYRLKEEA